MRKEEQEEETRGGQQKKALKTLSKQETETPLSSIELGSKQPQEEQRDRNFINTPGSVAETINSKVMTNPNISSQPPQKMRRS